MKLITNQPKVIGLAAVAATVAVTGAVTWLLYQHTVDLLTENLRQRLLSIAITSSTQISAEDLDVLRAEEDWKRPEWRRVVTQMRKIRTSNSDIIFIYILRKDSKDSSKIAFIADSHSINPYANTDDDPSNDVDVDQNGVIDDTDKLQWPGQYYEEPPEEAFLAYEKPVVSELYADEFGVFMTGYAPIRSEDGKVSGVIGVDVQADEFFTITSQTLYPFIAFIAFLLIAILVLSTTLIFVWNKQVKLVEELDRQKDELLSIVSHQLATPATSVKWYLEMMQSGDIGQLTKEQSEHVAGAQTITEKLVELIGMILDVSRIQLGKMKVQKEELDLAKFFKELITVIEPRAKQKNVNFKYTIPEKFPKAMLDRRLMNMTIENLLSNAVKYTPEGGNVDFTVEIKDDRMYCTVKDTGCGIPEKDQPHMFDKLYRASNVRNTVEGNGFGLYVAKGAVESQGGKISFVSKEGKGTTFFVEYPLHD